MDQSEAGGIETLLGGLGNEGRVVRVGNTVRRPIGPWTPAVHTLLRHLESVGFEGAPRAVGLDHDTEILTFVPGQVAIPPFPAWSVSDELLVSVAELQRRYHVAVVDFRPATNAIWGQGPEPDGYAGTLVCHNDLCLQNVVVRDGQAVGFIDFDFASPVDPVWDIAIALRHWVPMWDPHDLGEQHGGLDKVERCRHFFDAHRLHRRERIRTLDALLAFSDRALVFVRAQAESGHTGHRAQWDAGYEAKNRRAQAWVAANREVLSGE